MDSRFLEEAEVKKRRHAKLVHEGKYVAEVDGRGHVELVETGEGWSPYLSLEDAYKLDAVREALHLSLTKPSTVWTWGIYSFCVDSLPVHLTGRVLNLRVHPPKSDGTWRYA
jgi:hypothetical protein